MLNEEDNGKINQKALLITSRAFLVPGVLFFNNKTEMETSVSALPAFAGVRKASENIRNTVNHTPLIKNKNLSETWQAGIWLKREDLPVVRSYKIRGAYNKICMLSGPELKNGVVCASAGNHAQGVAFSCHKLGIKGSIFMPSTTQRQKIRQVETFGREYVDIILTGDSYVDCSNAAIAFCETKNSTFIHPFDDPMVIRRTGYGCAGNS